MALIMYTYINIYYIYILNIYCILISTQYINGTKTYVNIINFIFVEYPNSIMIGKKVSLIRYTTVLRYCKAAEKAI